MLPKYSGGLGILAGDHLKAASDLGVPLIGVGLLYRAGYFEQSLSADGLAARALPVPGPARPAGEAAARGRRLRHGRSPCRCPRARTLHAHVWRAQVGRVPLLLLDSDIEENAPAERGVTDRLYGGDEDHRLRQEMLLGIGGVRAVRAYCRLTDRAQPEVFHANEGHAGFQGVERIRELQEAHGLGFAEALQAVRAGTVFTTHTPVPAGHRPVPEGADRALLRRLRRPDAGAPGAGRRGGPHQVQHGPHGPAARSAGQRRAASCTGTSAAACSPTCGPGFDESDVPIGSITNGVHAPTWTARELVEMGTQTTSQGDPVDVDGPVHFDGVDSDQGRGPVEHPADAAHAGWSRRCAAGSATPRCPAGPPRPRSAGRRPPFDPDVLTIGFARRVPSYKRLTLMLRDPERLKALLLDPERPIQLIIAGQEPPGRRRRQEAHPGDGGLRRRPGDPAPDRVPARLRHRHGPVPLLGLRRLAEQPAAAAGGLRHVRA